MKSLSSLLRVVVFAACTFWLIRAPSVHAQGECIKQFYTENGSPCFSCCASTPQVQDLSDGTEVDPSPGFVSLMPGSADCGSGASTCPPSGGPCGSTQYFQAVQDSSCCSPSGSPCDLGRCCSGLMCLSDNTCGTCIGDGGTCGADSDCCSGTCLGSCVEACLPDYSECFDDYDCCSGVCDDSDFYCYPF